MVLDPITKRIEVPCSQEQAFRVFIQDMPRWWPLDKRAMSLYNGGPPKGLRVDVREGGQIVETGHDDTEYLWGTITQYEPHELIRMSFHMGLPPEQSSVVEVRFTVLEAQRTRVVLTQSHWEGFGDMAQMMYDGYGSSWGLIFEEAYGSACAR
jgi:hypothetical protein